VEKNWGGRRTRRSGMGGRHFVPVSLSFFSPSLFSLSASRARLCFPPCITDITQKRKKNTPTKKKTNHRDACLQNEEEREKERHGANCLGIKATSVHPLFMTGIITNGVGKGSFKFILSGFPSLVFSCNGELSWEGKLERHSCNWFNGSETAAMYHYHPTMINSG